MENNLDLNKKLWLTLKNHNCKGEHYIFYNPHTFHGRIAGYCTEEKRSFIFSVSEIDSMSLETEYWIKGYLVGNEPYPPLDEEGDCVHFESEEYKHWAESTELFHNTGYWNSSERNCEICGQKLLNSWQQFKCAECIKKG
jgi:hypothetical protein